MGQASGDLVPRALYRVLSGTKSQSRTPRLLYVDGDAELKADRWSVECVEPGRRALSLRLQLSSRSLDAWRAVLAKAEEPPREAGP